jgi:hypothetical protein
MEMSKISQREVKKKGGLRSKPRNPKIKDWAEGKDPSK